MAPYDAKASLGAAHAALLLLAPWPLVYALAALGFHAGIPIAGLHGVAALLLLAVLAWRVGIGKRAVVVAGCFTLLAAAISAFFYDISYDGTQYHQEAIIQLAHGYNPFREYLSPDRWDASWALWINTLPKFTWICGAVVYALTGCLEVAKIQTLILMAGLGFYAFHVLRNRWVATLLALNPVYLTQYLSNYTDAAASIWATLAVLALVETWRHRTAQAWGVALVFVCCAALTKITALLVVLPALVVFFAALVAQRQWPVLRQYSVSLVVAGVLAAVVLGFNPYITNMARYANPLFPLKTEKLFGLKGAGNTLNGNDIIYTTMTANLTPPDFKDMLRVEQLFRSVFSRVQNSSGVNGEPTQLKIPGVITSDREIRSFGNPDVRTAGWGPLFSLALVLGAVVLAITWRRNTDIAKIVLGTWIFIAITLAVHPEAWWARYAPQLWALPLLALLLPVRKPLRIMLLLTLCLNVLFVGGSYIAKNQRVNKKMHRAIAAAQVQSFYEVNLGNSWAQRVRYGSNGVRFVPTQIETDYMRDQIMPQVSDDERALLERLYKNTVITDSQNLAPPLNWDKYDRAVLSGYAFSGIMLVLKEDASVADKNAAAGVFERLVQQPLYARRPLF